MASSSQPRTMPCLSLSQPWATLIAVGAKTMETRSWRTYYAGPLAIHAAKGFPAYARETLRYRNFVDALAEAGYTIGMDPARRGSMRMTPRSAARGDRRHLPAGALRADGGHRADPPGAGAGVRGLRARQVGLGARRRGAVRVPIPAIGHLGLWEWQVPEGVMIDGN